MDQITNIIVNILTFFADLTFTLLPMRMFFIIASHHTLYNHTWERKTNYLHRQPLITLKNISLLLGRCIGCKDLQKLINKDFVMIKNWKGTFLIHKNVKKL